MKEIVEYCGQKCFTTTYGMCFIKCKNDFAENEYTEEFPGFIIKDQ